MSELPPCPFCSFEYTYEDGETFHCPECGQQWKADDPALDDSPKVLDANGNQLRDGDSITVIKDLKIKGSSSVVKVGSKAKNIRLVEGDHPIDCKIDGIGSIQLKCEFVRKV